MNEQQLQGFLSFLVQGQRNLKARVCQLEVNESLRNAAREPRLPVEFRSQFGEDALLWDLFKNQLDGFFIEVGAYDGLKFSVSYAFEAMGWQGLLVEALPAPAEQCRQNRPNSRVVHAALSAPGGGETTTFNVVRGGEGDQLSYHTTGPDHLRRLTRASAVASQITVPLATMNDLLAEHRGPIDFASIDVEGGELALLEGFDLERFRPRVLLIEETVVTANSPITAQVTKFGYVPGGRISVNNWYLRQDDFEMIQRAQSVSG